MGTRDNIFNRPISTVVDFVWVELNRAIQLLVSGGINFEESEIARTLKDLAGDISPMVDQRLVAGSRASIAAGSRAMIFEENNKFNTKEDKVCEAWSTVRATILWVLPQVENKKLPERYLKILLDCNKKLSLQIRKRAPRATDGTERFSSKSTMECEQSVALKTLRNSFIQAYSSSKAISIGQLPIAVVTKRWDLPLSGWTQDLVEEAGFVLGEIAAGSERDIFLPERSTRCPEANTALAKEARQLCSPESMVSRAVNNRPTGQLSAVQSAA